MKDYFEELLTAWEGSNGISLTDPSIDTEIGAKDVDNNGDSAGDQYEDEDEGKNQGNASDASEHSAKQPSQLLRELWISITPGIRNEDDENFSEIDEIIVGLFHSSSRLSEQNL